MLDIRIAPLPILKTQRLLLRQMRPEDQQELFILRSDPRILEYIHTQPAATPDHALAFIEMINSRVEQNETAFWGITTGEKDSLIGTCVLWHIQKEHHRAEVGYVLHPDYWRRGLAKEALAAMISYGFNELKLHSLEAQVAPQNIASIRVLEKTGFVKDGYFRENFYHEGNFLDTAVYSLINHGTAAEQK